MVQTRAQHRRRPAAIFRGAENDDHVGRLRLVPRGLLFDPDGDISDVYEDHRDRQHDRVAYEPSHLRYSDSIVRNGAASLCSRLMAKAEVITSAANPLLKD